MSVPHAPNSRRPRPDSELGNEAQLAALVNLYRRAIDRYEEAQRGVCPDHASTNDRKEESTNNSRDNEASASEQGGRSIALPHQEHRA